MREPEIPMRNRGVTTVMRAGGTVRREPGPWTSTVHALLRYLEEQGFAGAPRARGFDEHGREVLTFLDGAVPTDATPAFVAGDEPLVAVADLVRRYHEIVAGFTPPEDARWQTKVGVPAGGDVICHNDLAPYNAVFRDGLPRGFIDWDLAAPAPRTWDVAYVMWRWVPLYPDDVCASLGWARAPDRAARARLIADAYGLDARERAHVPETIEARVASAIATLRAWGGEGRPGWRDMLRSGYAEGYERNLAWLREERDALRQAMR